MHKVRNRRQVREPLLVLGPDPGAAITWARELMGVSKKLLTPSIIEAVVEKVNQKRITNSKDLRKLRTILRDPVARAEFLTEEGDLESAQLRLRPTDKRPNDGFVAELDAIDGTPVLDLKPVMSEFLPREPVRQPSWSHELMREYWSRGK